MSIGLQLEPSARSTVIESGMSNKFQDDIEDYCRWLVEYGFDHEHLKAIIESHADQIPMPPEYEAAVLNGSPIHGLGMFATRQIKAGELIAPARLNRKRTPAGRYTNHSVRPNAIFTRVESRPDGDLHMLAKRDISKGDEILIDYRQAGSVNGWELLPDREESIKTVHERFLRRGYPANMTPQILANLAGQMLDTIGYVPSDISDLIAS